MSNITTTDPDIEPRFLPIATFSVPAAALASALYFATVPFLIYAVVRIKPGPRGVDTRSPYVNLALDFGIGRAVAFILRAVLINNFSFGLLLGYALPFGSALPGPCIQITVLTRVWALKAVALGVDLVPGRTIKQKAGIVNLVFLASLLILLGGGVPMIIMASIWVVHNKPGEPQHDLGVRLRLACDSLLVLAMVCTILIGFGFLKKLRQFDMSKLRQLSPVKKKVEENGKGESESTAGDSPESLMEALPIKIDAIEAISKLRDGLTRLIIPCATLLLARLVAGLCYLPTDSFVGTYSNEATWYPFVVGFEILTIITLVQTRSYAYINVPWPSLEDDVEEEVKNEMEESSTETRVTATGEER
ncbi:hypothetical protein M427DRAFT_145636 [Gonapodya prolifera JEL478]|uniref:Uncharacterized protein n=1 Tax=Gonapodya prolifera (strain JEL478) TaxID=1344416 RepID=A0A139AES2_GONPJ|nr:hypothetical protein M427DRAFT_145636 [Gonapodya prolifera JEL478]|eukprot:KXS15301.1 hypothetical protein M427DRAFT_145636 [Gonapodya prolifera JEL478]